MKLRIRDRLLSALMGLIILVLAAYALLYLLGILPDWNGQYAALFKVAWHGWVAEGICVLLMLIGVCGIAVLFRRRKDKGVVVQHTEYGDMSISMKAMENMVKKCVDAHPELNVNHTRISHSRSGICVDIKITLMNGINIPLTVNALQKQIKQYITSCSGVDVEEVRVMVETETVKRLPAPEVIETPVVVEMPAEPGSQAVEKATECLCQHQEEPAAYAETAVQPAEATEEAKPEEPKAEETEPVAEMKEEVCEETAEENAEEIVEMPAEEAEEAED